MGTILCILIYGMIFLKYELLFKTLTVMAKKKVICALSGLLVVVFFSAFLNSIQEEVIISLVYFISLLCYFITLNNKGIIVSRLGDIFGVTCVEQIVFGLLKRNVVLKSTHVYFSHVVMNGIVIALIILIIMSKKSIIKMKKRTDIDLYRYFSSGVAIGTICLMVWIALLEKLIESGVVFTDKILMILVMIAYFLVLYVGVLALSIEKKRNEKEELVKWKDHLSDLQKKYYELLLEKEIETKRYRHDMKSHLICLEKLMQIKDYDKAVNYITQLNGELNRISKMSYDIGNEILEIVTTHYLGMLKADAYVVVSGVFRAKIDEMKLCGIYANLLLNAIEECNRCENIPSLRINFSQGNDYCGIEIWNSLCGLHANKKRETEDHGHGLKNVQRWIDECNGFVSTTVTDKEYYVKVILKNTNHS